MTILSSISSAFGIPNPITALSAAVQQAGAATTDTSSASATSATHSHHGHHGGGVPTATDSAATTGTALTATAAGASTASTNLPNAFVNTLESALATLGATQTGGQSQQAGSGATTKLFA